MRIDETDLDLFRHIAEAGSITHGAARSNMALTAASARVRSMEARLGVLLLERKRHGAVLSPAGRALLAHARQLLAQADRLREDLALFQGGVAGQVRLFANTNAFAIYLPTALAPFLLAHPNIDIRVAERPSELIIGLVADGTAEIGIVAAETDLAGLTGELVAQDRYVVATPKQHALARHQNIDFASTLAFDFVAGPSHGLFETKATRLGKQIRTRVRMRDDAQVCQLVAAGIGLGIVPLSVVQSVQKRDRLALVDLSEPWAARRMHACVLDRQALSRPAQLLFEHLVGSGQSGPQRPPPVSKGKKPDSRRNRT